MGLFLRISGLALFAVMTVQLAAFLSTAVYDTGPLRLEGFWIFRWPSKAAVEDTFFFFDAIMGSLLWVFEFGLGALLIVTGRRITARERGDRLAEEQAIERILRDREVRLREDEMRSHGDAN